MILLGCRRGWDEGGKGIYECRGTLGDPEAKEKTQKSAGKSICSKRDIRGDRK
jgi:hypothetical protein